VRQIGAQNRETRRAAQGDIEPGIAFDTSPPNMYNTVRFYPGGWIPGVVACNSPASPFAGDECKDSAGTR